MQDRTRLGHALIPLKLSMQFLKAHQFLLDGATPWSGFLVDCEGSRNEMFRLHKMVLTLLDEEHFDVVFVRRLIERRNPR